MCTLKSNSELRSAKHLLHLAAEASQPDWIISKLWLLSRHSKGSSQLGTEFYAEITNVKSNLNINECHLCLSFTCYMMWFSFQNQQGTTWGSKSLFYPLTQGSVLHYPCGAGMLKAFPFGSAAPHAALYKTATAEDVSKAMNSCSSHRLQHSYRSIDVWLTGNRSLNKLFTLFFPL